MTEALVILVPALPVGSALALQLAPSARVADLLSPLLALLTAAAALLLGVHALADAATPTYGSWYAVDAASGAYLCVIAVVGLLSAAVSPVYLAGAGRGLFGATRARHFYYLAFHLFWASLLALPIVGNLGIAWLLIELTTGTSALLVAFSGKRSALEAGWKYLVLTSFGLTISLVGVIVLYTGLSGHAGSLATLDFREIARHAPALPSTTAALALVLIVGGLAAKIGWAPVHNWLPDAHSEAPPPISAMLSGALLPTVMLVAWRTFAALTPPTRTHAGVDLFIGFGLASLALAAPFMWRALAWKRLLAYSSLEHMGVIALGIAFGTPLAVAGVILHVAGHALAKSLGFYAAIPLLRHQPDAATQPPVGIARASAGAGAALGISLASLGGTPPSPLFFSELLILAGGFQSGHVVVAAVAAGLLALGFLGLLRALIEGLLGGEHQRPWLRGRTVRATERLTVVIGAGMIALSAAAYALPHWSAVHLFMRGLQ